MKKILFILVAFTSFLVSCDIETSDNGNLDGYWHIVAVDTLANSAHTDMSNQKVYWAFQKNLLQLRGSTDTEKALQEFYLRFSLDKDMLTLSDIHLRDREKDDPLVDESTMPLIYIYGINQMRESFQVLKLNGHEMVIQNETIRISFVKM